MSSSPRCNVNRCMIIQNITFPVITGIHWYIHTFTSLLQIWHYNDVIMTTIASQITSLTVVYSTVYSDADQRKHQSSASLAFVWGIHRDRWIPRTKGQLRGKCFHLMTSSWLVCFPLLLRLFSISANAVIIRRKRRLTLALNYNWWRCMATWGNGTGRSLCNKQRAMYSVPIHGRK